MLRLNFTIESAIAKIFLQNKTGRKNLIHYTTVRLHAPVLKGFLFHYYSIIVFLFVHIYFNLKNNNRKDVWKRTVFTSNCTKSRHLIMQERPLYNGYNLDVNNNPQQAHQIALTSEKLCNFLL